ncbi:hypothetical protein JAAARDRAFT_37097 [Jaapia argillacea MUCL 33604]|uniref:Uncharacterized protein n=1 Tax=Jaapia argillacea MUCL 33604 TaxID=933084 RepID=A0A067PLB8_9AGAM|nr:hypothetical protein JAAARDRAFT_37097 [Jaapia argillacea MUCL 33604]
MASVVPPIMARDHPPRSSRKDATRPPPIPTLTPAQAIAKAWQMESTAEQKKWREADAKARAQFFQANRQTGRRGLGSKM